LSRPRLARASPDRRPIADVTSVGSLVMSAAKVSDGDCTVPHQPSGVAPIAGDASPMASAPPRK
jgi:hypothetical protein